MVKCRVLFEVRTEFLQHLDKLQHQMVNSVCFVDCYRSTLSLMRTQFHLFIYIKYQLNINIALSVHNNERGNGTV
jgi:hypothetical protein